MEITGERKIFLDFINGLRKEKGYTMRQLCQGLCSHGTIEAMEDGCWEPDKLLQDSILERLGIAAEDYVHGLDFEDYDRWMARTHILHSITFCQPEQAAELLAEYEKVYDVEKKHERQFWLAMKAQVRRLQGCQEEELSGLFQEAAALTVPGWEEASLEGLVLSVKEWNLILEAEHSRPEGERTERYREIADTIARSGLDGVGMAKIYPKAVYFLCRSIGQNRAEGWGPEALLYYSGLAIKILRDHKRMYYLWELVKLRSELACLRAEELEYRGEQEKSRDMRELCKEMGDWRQALEAAYADRKVPKETFEFCYLYVMKGVYCINDVIPIRRRMRGLSQRELCRDICDVRTLRRIESRKTRPRRAVAAQLMEKLKLSGEFIRTELVTDSREARELMTELRRLVNMERWEKAEQVGTRIRERVPMELLYNQQTILEKEILLKWKQGEIGDEEYLVRMRNILELTLPYEAFLRQEEIYLTGVEQICILNRMEAMEKESEEYMLCMKQLERIYQFYIDEEIWEGAWNMYELFMYNIGSYRGDMGDYEGSDRYNEMILEGCLRFRRMSHISSCIYGRWWNHDMRKQKGIHAERKLDDTEELTRCIRFSMMTGDERRERFYRQKLEAVRKSK